MGLGISSINFSSSNPIDLTYINVTGGVVNLSGISERKFYSYDITGLYVETCVGTFILPRTEDINNKFSFFGNTAPNEGILLSHNGSKWVLNLSGPGFELSENSSDDVFNISNWSGGYCETNGGITAISGVYGYSKYITKNNADSIYLNKSTPIFSTPVQVFQGYPFDNTNHNATLSPLSLTLHDYYYGDWVSSVTDGNYQIAFNGSPVLYLTNNTITESNVGIGTTTPTEKLEVIGNIIAQNLVYNTGDQTISGVKDFTIRPTVNTVPVALSGEASSNIEQWVKNGYGATLYKAQPVYVSGSNGNNILIHPASNSGEGTSSKTFGLLKQTLLDNEQGYVVTEGALLNVDTSMAVEGDPVWLGPTGNLIYGLVNKPKAPQHLVSLGFVERAHQNQGKIFVKVQNGFEIEELHDVRIVNKQDSDIIIYNSGSGLWLNSGVNFNNFYTKDNPSGFITGVDLSTYATITNLESTGSTLDTKINSLSGNSVLKIEQNKNFVFLPTSTGNGTPSTIIAYGANCTITPKYVGTVRADAAISMTCISATSADVQQAATFWYGTGTAPVYSGNLVSLNGNRIGGLKSFHGSSQGSQNTIYPVSASWVAEITGLTTGNQYWFDIGISGSRMRVQDVQLYIEEKY